VLITEKSGNIIHANIENKKQKKVKHNLQVLEHGQGGLLDVLYHNQKVFISYSEKEKILNPAHQLLKASIVTLK
jgi:quinoprotein glucose dehydrogenase